MPYIKPGELLQLQIAASKGSIEAYDREEFDTDALRSAVRRCFVCGSDTCDKTLVCADGVYVHREEVLNSKEIERPGL
jgi:hypothetical protein